MRFVCVLIIVVFSGVAVAQPATGWGVTGFEFGGVEAGDVATFQSLFVSELRAKSKQHVTENSTACADAACAQAAGKTMGAETVVFGRLSRLGQKIIVALTAIETATGAVQGSHRLTIDQVEDLEAASTRFARAFVENTPIAEGAELGSVTANEARPDRRREGDSGLSLRVGGAFPTSTTLDSNSGVLFDLGYWYETRDFVIEPRLGFRWSVGEENGSYYVMTLMDVFLSHVFSPSDFAPFAGFGAGLRGVNQGVVSTFEVGEVVRLEGERLDEESTWGLGVAARGGLLFLRTYSTRVALTVDYDVTFADPHSRGALQMVTGGISVIF